MLPKNGTISLRTRSRANRRPPRACREYRALMPATANIRHMNHGYTKYSRASAAGTPRTGMPDGTPALLNRYTTW